MSFLLESVEAKCDRIIADSNWRSSIPLPTPEERDRAIYEAIYIDSEKPYKVARDYNLTPQTVKNIARETRDKLARREHELDKLLRSDSLKTYYDELLSQKRELKESWDASKRGQTTLMLVEDGREPTRETIRNQGVGDVRLMRLWHQISEKMQAIAARFAVDDMPERAEGEAAEPAQGAEAGERAEPNGQAMPSAPRTEKRPSRRRRIGRSRGGLGDTFSSLPEGVSTGSEELDRQHLAAINGLPFPAEPCGCGDGGP